MIEPEDVARFRRHVGTMLRMAGDDAEAFASIAGVLQEGMDGLPDAASVLRRHGVSFDAIARALGVKKASAHERFGMVPRPAHVEAIRRRVRAAGMDPTLARTRVTAAEDEDGTAHILVSQARDSWLRVRHCATLHEAVNLAEYVAEACGWKSVGSPRDLPTAAREGVPA